MTPRAATPSDVAAAPDAAVTHGAVPDVPPADEVTGPWWDATRERRLLVQTCGACGAAQHPPGALCRRCGAVDALSWADAAGAGTVDACTVVMRSPSPALEPPYVVARVRLDEGPLLLTTVLAGDPHAVGIGDRVALDWRPLPDGRALPVFVPDPARPDPARPDPARDGQLGEERP